MKMKNGSSAVRWRIAAFSLVEVTIALGISATSLVAVFGLLPLGVTSNKTCFEQTAAANLARTIIADLRSTPASSGASVLYGLPLPVAGGGSTIGGSACSKTLLFSGDGSSVSQGSSASRYRAAVGFAPPGSGKLSTAVRIVITWPAAADTTQNTWAMNSAGSYEIVTALDRN